MAPTGIVDLPYELLDHLFSYLDWKRTEDYRPLSRRQDLVSIATVCKDLRRAAIPRLFHTVVLRLKWKDRSLVGPSLYRLRLHAPRLFEHVREVFVETNFQRDDIYPSAHPSRRGLFNPPKAINDWTNPSSSPLPTEQHNVDLLTSHRERIDDAARKLATTIFPDIELEQHNSAEYLISQMTDKILHIQESLHRSARPNFRSSVAVEANHYDEEYQPHDSDTSVQSNENRRRYSLLRKKQQVDALAVLILCLPPSLKSVIFEACPSPTYSAMDLDQYDFALELMTAIINIYGERIEKMAMACNQPSPRRRLHLGTVRDEVLLDSDMLSKLTGVKTLILGSDAFRTSLADQDLTKWHSLSNSVKNLELWNFTCSAADSDNLDILIALIHGFTGLKHLTLNNISYLGNIRRRVFSLLVQPVPAPNLTIPATAHSWLIFAIAIRRAHPDLHLHLTSLLYDTPSCRLPDMAITWLLKEAVPRHTNLGLPREQRLMEDFASYLPLWDAESGVRGQQAAEHRKSGVLVDEAMSRRGHQPQAPLNTWGDQGEWWTM